MAQSEYVFQRVEDQRELERLRLIERVFDPGERCRNCFTREGSNP